MLFKTLTEYLVHFGAPALPSSMYYEIVTVTRKHEGPKFQDMIYTYVKIMRVADDGGHLCFSIDFNRSEYKINTRELVAVAHSAYNRAGKPDYYEALPLDKVKELPAFLPTPEPQNNSLIPSGNRLSPPTENSAKTE